MDRLRQLEEGDLFIITNVNQKLEDCDPDALSVLNPLIGKVCKVITTDWDVNLVDGDCDDHYGWGAYIMSEHMVGGHNLSAKGDECKRDKCYWVNDYYIDYDILDDINTDEIFSQLDEQEEDEFGWVDDVIDNEEDCEKTVIITNTGGHYSAYLNAMAELNIPEITEKVYELRKKYGVQDVSDNRTDAWRNGLSYDHGRLIDELKNLNVIGQPRVGDVCCLYPKALRNSMTGAIIRRLIRLKDGKNFIMTDDSYKDYNPSGEKLVGDHWTTLDEQEEDDFGWAEELVNNQIELSPSKHYPRRGDIVYITSKDANWMDAYSECFDDPQNIQGEVLDIFDSSIEVLFSCPAGDYEASFYVPFEEGTGSFSDMNRYGIKIYLVNPSMK